MDINYRLIFVSRNEESHNLIKDIIRDFTDRGEAEKEQDRLIDNIQFKEEAISCKVNPFIICECGKEVVCSCFTNTCNCGLEYNFAGQLLSPRDKWGYETGECSCDCV